MVMTKFSTDALSGICTQEQLNLLDSVDTLRLQGISHYVSLPQIIVCGDQSSGKSSVLEAISGVAFPVKSNLCTRFPTELVLRKSSQIGVSVSIVPHPSRSESEQRSLSTFRETLDSFDSLPILIENAKSIMGISTHGKAFSNDILRVEAAGPDRPHLTIVDLPGLIHSETKQQSAADVTLVQEVVQKYMREPRSIILAVVSAKNDFANQIVLRLARNADESGYRTMGVITKPDVLIPGSETEKMFVSLAKNQEVDFRLGWHVLKNMDTEKARGTLSDRDAQEREFFSQGVWEFMPKNLLGIDGLRDRLSALLLSQIATELPNLIDEIKVQVDRSNEELKRLGNARETLQQQQAYLFQISQAFQTTVKAAVDGTYNSAYFDDIHADSGYRKRLRAVVQNLNETFADNISRHGHRRKIAPSSGPKDLDHDGQIMLTRAEYIQHIEKILKRTRGRELPGTFNPMIISELFMEQCTLWEGSTIAHIADNATSTVLVREILEPKLDDLRQAAQEKILELLLPHTHGHPITYNHYFTENLQKIRNERREKEIMRSIQAFFNASDIETVAREVESVDLRGLSRRIIQSTEPDMGRFASAEALDCMLAYYKASVALKRFIDDVAVEAVENKLVVSLSDLFSPIAVFEMAPEMVTSIAGETKEYRSLREQLSKKLDILARGLETCKKFVGIRGIVIESNMNPTSASITHSPRRMIHSLVSEQSDGDVSPPVERLMLKSPHKRIASLLLSCYLTTPRRLIWSLSRV
uniref:Interferon-induced GTP-binding protein Mx1 n=1 Tax=Talaromyces marneffei PM1 TaxID=1077442 RepID=A0A093UU45_TALMA